MSDLFGDGNGWLICGLVFIIVEMLMNLGYVSISFGVGSLLTGLLIKVDSLPTTFDTGLIDELFVAATKNVKSSDLSSVLRCLTLSVIEVCRNRNNCIIYFFTQICF